MLERWRRALSFARNGGISKDGVSGGLSAQATAAKAEAKGKYGDAEGSVSATLLQGKAGVAGELSTKKVGVDACVKGEALSGEVKGSVPLPGTDRKITTTAGLGVGAAACVKAEASDKVVGAKVDLGLGLNISVGGRIEKRRE